MLISKTETAGRNEVLCKILCHNLCVNIMAMYVGDSATLPELA